MFKKMLGLAALLVLWLVLLCGAAVMAQDVCVTEYMANLATPTTVTELRQYLEDIRQVLRECDPPPEGITEVEVQRKADLDLFEKDEYGCYAGVTFGERNVLPYVYATAEGDAHENVLIKLKKPGETKFEAASEVEARTYLNAPDKAFNFHSWGNRSMPKGSYEVQYEAFVAADPVTLAFDVEHNSNYRIHIYCD